jgi:acetyl-CoA carboxylase biotin carboxyl carrier protein
LPRMARRGDLEVDRDLIRALAALLHETGLSEIEYAVGDRRIRVARSAPQTAVSAPPPPPPTEARTPARESAGTVSSPMVGTVYLAPEPAAAPFVVVGDAVQAGQVLLVIEAMKVMNQIHAPKAGRVAQILVVDGAPVEYGQALVILD